MRRYKTSKIHLNLSILPHADDPMMCAIHSLAVVGALALSGNEKIFPDFQGKSITSVVNQGYKRIGAIKNSSQNDTSFAQTFTNPRIRDARHIGTQLLCDAPDTKIEWVVNRTGWRMDSMQTVFNYIGGSDKSGII